jgi:cobalt-zinc-cadmium efflux system membrane fusion protein
MRSDIARTILLASLLIALPACRRTDAHAHDEHEEDAAHGDANGERAAEDHDGERHQHGEGAGDASASPGRVALAGVRGVAFAAVGEPIEEGVWRPAEAVADESERMALAAPVDGLVATIHVAPGRDVDAGARLLSIRSPELAELSAAWLSRQALREQAAAELAREERLAAAGAGALRELEAARAALAVARAEEQAARLALEARGVSPGQAGATLAIRAPRAGRVASYDVLAGAGVAAGQQLGTFETGRATVVAIELPLPGPPAWTPGAATTVRRGDGATWQAKVEGLPASLSPETRRLRYRLRLDAEDALIAGTPLEVRVPLPAGIVVPQDALQQVEGEWGVFVTADGAAVFTPVRRGPELGGDVVVLAGLSPGQRIATSGAYLLKAMVLKQAGGGEAHAH